MTVAHISPKVFSLQSFLGNIHVLFYIIHLTSLILIIHHIQTSNYSFYLHDKFPLSFLRFFIAGWLPLVSRVRYIYTIGVPCKSYIAKQADIKRLLIIKCVISETLEIYLLWLALSSQVSEIWYIYYFCYQSLIPQLFFQNNWQ